MPGTYGGIPKRAMTPDTARSAPLSFAQQRLWLLDRLYPGESVYNEPQALRLSGTLDRDALRRSLNEVVRRHAILRTRYMLEDAQPVQVVVPASVVPLDVQDLRALPEAERETAARRLAQEERRARFDLAQGPLLRARLVCLRDTEHWLLLTMHHIVTDAWSAGVLWAELAALYGAFHAGRPSPLHELPMQYADHAVRQRGRLEGDALEKPVAYWKRALAGLPELELPTDRPRPPRPDHAGARVTFVVDADLTRRLKELARRERATLFMTLLAAFHVLLHRYTGQEDIAVGVPIAGRSEPELEPLIGFFVNMLVMRGDLSGQPGFDVLLGRVRRRALEAYEHQELPFEKLVMELAPVRTASRHPLFQVSFALHNAGQAPWRLPGLIVEEIDGLGGDDAKFDLSLTLTEAAGVLRGSIDFAVSLFEAPTVERMALQFRTLLSSIVTDPRQRIGRLALQDAEERERRLAEGTRTRSPYPETARIERLFEVQAAVRPDAVAVVDADGPLSYRELDARANRLARELDAAGLDSPRRVGVCLERGSDLVVGLLATLKAGAAYLPLDPEVPVERLRAMLADASVTLVLTTERLSSRLPVGGHRVVCIDRDATRIARRRGGNVETGGRADDIAYVMYTSGSTGNPKGVLIPHRAVVRLVCGTDYVRLGPDDVVAHLSNPAFDAATFEIWGALLNGASLVPVDKATALAPRSLAAALRANGVTTLFLTTALFNAVAREVPDAFAGCRQVLFGGEAVEPRWVRDVMRAGPPARLVHVYGPTEATTFATWHEVRADDAERATIPIGRPIANTEVVILDGEREPVPVGVPGEIHVGGPGLARGYLGPPELTAERFVPHPFDADPAARLYRTGDRARCRADGAVEFMGRLDRQVKIRGHRIELAEIESAIARLPYVRDAVVLARGATTDTRRIVAWLVSANAGGPPPANLRRDLRRVLPDYMLPAATVWMPALPLTANGKVDHRALPEPGATARPADGVPVPPRDMFEGVLVRIWEDLLGIRGIGVFDHFFEIGGHSLLAARLVDTIERETGLAVPLTAMFADDTIAGLANALRDGAPDANAPIVVVNGRGSRPPFVFLHGDFQAGGFYSLALARALGPDQPTLIVHPHGLTGDAVPETIEAMAADRIRALRTFRPAGPYVIGGHCNGALVAFEMARQLVAAGDAVPAVVLIESRAPAPGAEPSAGGTYVKFDAAGRAHVLASRDRLSEIELRYTRAIDAYAGAPLDGHAVVVQAEEWRAAAPDAGWSRFVRTWEGHVLPGGHVTMITRHLAELARVIGGVVERASEVPA
ncbi:enterobactin synthetase component F [Burkholderiales bacterium]|nr:enterobactin synthetase component F [Burkholderiales bacterium]